jgi:DNA-binding response OmpR family regulator
LLKVGWTVAATQKRTGEICENAKHFRKSHPSCQKGHQQMSEKILVVEDEISLQETLVYNLKRSGYDVDSVGNGLAALETARQNKPDLILLDIMLPGMDGFEVCRTLRQEINTPIIFLTARDEEIDRVVGLEIGADDYINKPFSMRELLARVKARLRTTRLLRESMASAISEPPVTNNYFSSGNLTVDLMRHEVQMDGTTIPLKPREFDLLAFLFQNTGRVLSRETLFKRVWGWNFTGDSRTVDVHVRWLREKIEENPEDPVRIVTVRGAGYRFEG